MSLSLVRIDCRLIHGQVLNAWVPHVRSDRIVVADDDLARNSLRQAIISASVPRSLEVKIDTVEGAVTDLLRNGSGKNRVLLLFSDCRNARRAYSLGLHFPAINVGNIHFCEGAHAVTSSVALNASDYNCLKELEWEGVEVELRAVPGDRRLRLKDIASISQ